MSHEARLFQESTFETSDGEALYFRHWPATEGKSKKVIVLFHRGHEHSGRLQHIVDELVMPDTHFYAWDARGHGQSPGARGYSPSLARSVQDVDEFVRFVATDAQVNFENIVVIAQSVGAVLVSTWAHDYAPKIRGMVLASPAFSVKLYVPFARPGLTLMRRIRGMFYVNSYVKGKFLSHDPERIASFEQDKLITRAIAVNILLDLYKTAKRIVSDSAAITLPTQCHKLAQTRHMNLYFSAYFPLMLLSHCQRDSENTKLINYLMAFFKSRQFHQRIQLFLRTNTHHPRDAVLVAG